MKTLADSHKGPGIHLILGSTGAGKSTYAKRLQGLVGAPHLAVDEWMTDLFAPDLEEPLDWGWISERALRCEQRIISTARCLAEQGVSSILEIGLQRADRRAQVVSALTAPASQANPHSAWRVQTHFLDVNADERWRRVQQRNQDKGPTFTLELSRELFDFFEDMWEPPAAAEPLNLTRIEMELLE